MNDTSHGSTSESRAMRGVMPTWQLFRPAVDDAPPLESQPNVLSSIYEEVAANRIDAALDLLYDLIDDLLTARSFHLCDETLANLDLDRLNDDVFVGALSITLAAKSALRARAAFYQRIEQRLVERHGPAEAEEMLRGLK